jgi:thiol-disulfide isomerase/thioredoxin
MKLASNVILKLLGILLLIAAVLKGWQLITEPVANNDIWSYRPFLILTVEFELALAIWLLSGLFKKAAWLVAISCFSLFSLITFYKGITGYASCGCFGKVHVNPWITLFAIDLPAVIALILFRPRLSFPSRFVVRGRLQRGSIKTLIYEFVTPLPSMSRFAVTACIGLLALGVTIPILAFNEPSKVTLFYEVLEPETWVGKKLPILEHIDIGNQLEKGNWLILLYHHDCPDCAKAIPIYEQMARDLEGNEDFLRIALVEVPPYGQGPISQNSPCCLSRLADSKEWFVTTPAVVLLANGEVTSAWEQNAPDLDTIVKVMLKSQKVASKFTFSTNKSLHTFAIEIERG